MKNTKYLIFMGIGFELIGIMISSLYLGQLLDEKLHTSGICTIIISMAGLGGWFYHLIILIKRVEANSSEETAGNTKDKQQ